MKETVVAQLCCALWLNLRVHQIPERKLGKASLRDGSGISR
jgi:hypothetical protein